MVVVPVVQDLVGVSQAAFESSPYAQTAFKYTVIFTLGIIQGASPNVTITGYIPTYTRRALAEAPRSVMFLRDVSDPTGVKVKYNILFTFTTAKADDSTAMLMASVNTTLTAAVGSVSGEASSFSKMLTMQFLNVSSAAGSIDANVFSGVTTTVPTVSAAVVTATTQAPVTAPTQAPTLIPVTAATDSKASNLSRTSQIIIGSVVGGGLFIIVTATAAYMRLRGTSVMSI